MLARTEDFILDDKVLVTMVTNPFKPHDRESRITQIVDCNGNDILGYIKEIQPFVKEGLELEASLNGRRILPEEFTSIIPRPKDNVVFCIVPSFGEGNDTVRTIAMLAVVVIAAYVSGGAGGYLGTSFQAGSWGAAVLGAVVAVGGSLLVNAILPPTVPDQPEGDSPTYGWNAGFNRDIEGYPVPILYGTHRIFPPIFSRHVSSPIWPTGWNANSVFEYLNLLFGLADHPIDGIGYIEINNNPIENYNEIITEQKLGTFDQTPCANFQDTITESVVGSRIPHDGSYSVSQRTDGDAVEGLRVGISFPSGLYFAGENNISTCAVWFHIEYRKVGDAAWTMFPGWVNYKYGTFNGSALYGFLVQAASYTPGTRVFEATNLPAGQYDVRIRFATSYSSLYGGKDHFDSYFSFLQEILPDDFSYPGRSLLAVKALATDQLSGAEPAISLLATRSTVDVYEPGVGWTTKPAYIPAWAAYDMLVNQEYGGGVDYTRMLYDDFDDWADFCIANGYVFNAYIDTAEGLRNKLSWPETIGRARVVQKGTDFGVIIDQASSPVQLFTYANIVKDSFRETYLSLADRVNCVEITFFDAEDHYERKTLALRSDTYDSDESIDDNRRSVTLYGCTDRALAIKHGKFLLNCNKYLKVIVEFDVSVDALGCVAGEVIHVSHDMPQWGYSGRIVSATANTAVLDRQVTLTPGTTYQILVRHSATDTIETQTLTTPGVATTSATVTLAGTWTTTPSKSDVYAFGVVSYATKQFRIMTITRSKDQNRKIRALEYNASVYNDSIPVQVEESYPTLSFVRNLAAIEVWENAESVVKLSWNGEAINWYVFYRESGQTGWVKLGETSKPHFDVHYLNPGRTYEFSVSGRNNPGYGEIVSLTFYGYGATLPDIPKVGGIAIVGRGFESTWLERDLNLTWTLTEFTFPDSAGEETQGAGTFITNVPATYKVQILNPDLTLRREETVTTNYYSYTYGHNSYDGGGTPAAALTVKVWAIDGYGRTSDQPAILEVTNPVPDDITGLRIASTSSTSEFNTKDIDLAWHASDNPDIKNYKVTIYDGSSNERRTVYIIDPHFVYSYDMNLEDGDLASTIVVKVWAQDAFNQLSAVADTETFVNALPDNVSGLTADAFIRGVFFKWAANTDKDFKEYKYRLKVGTDSWSAWATTPNTSISRSLTQTEQDDYDGQADIYIQVLAIDWFGSESASAAAANDQTLVIEVEATDINDFAITASKIWNKIPVLEADSWGDNFPSAGYVGWSQHILYYNGAAYTIAAANTNQKYIYWENGNSSYSTSDTNPTLNDGDFIIATNVSGIHDLAWNAIANEVIGSAYIQQLAVQNAHIANVSVEKLTAGSITSKLITLMVSAGGGDCAIKAGKTDFNNTENGFILGLDDSDSDLPKFFIGNATDYLNWTGANLVISVGAADGLIVKGGGNIRLEVGGDIHFYSSAYDPSQIIFYGGVTPYYTIAALPGGFYIQDLQGTGHLYLGSSTYPFLGITMETANAGSIVLNSIYDTNWFLSYTINNTVSYNMYHQWAIKGNGVTQVVRYEYDHDGDAIFVLYPTTDKAINLGKATQAWDDAYADDWNNVADFFHLDSFNDINIINGIKGSGQSDPITGIELIDDATLPDWLCKLNKDGQIERNSDDKPYIPLKAGISLSWGAIRQLDGMIRSLCEQLKIPYETLNP